MYIKPKLRVDVHDYHVNDSDVHVYGIKLLLNLY